MAGDWNLFGNQTYGNNSDLFSNTVWSGGADDQPAPLDSSAEAGGGIGDLFGMFGGGSGGGDGVGGAISSGVGGYSMGAGIGSAVGAMGIGGGTGGAAGATAPVRRAQRNAGTISRLPSP